MKTPDFRHLLARDLFNYCLSRGLPEAEAEVQTAKLLKFVDDEAYRIAWEKPEGCVCAGPTDPYHSYCEPCAERRERLNIRRQLSA